MTINYQEVLIKFFISTENNQQSNIESAADKVSCRQIEQ